MSAKKLGQSLLLIYLTLLCSSCILSKPENIEFSHPEFQSNHHKGDLSLGNPSPITGVAQEAKEYLNYYDLVVGNQRQDTLYSYGIARIGELKISAHVFFPKEPVGTIFILHGYFDHVGSLNHIVNYALEQNYAVFTYDLPGHGMSSGNRGDIGGFEQNSMILNNLVQNYSHALPKPYQLVGFSTGGTIALENALAEEDSPFEKKVFVSPLIHHAHWRWGNVAHALFKPFINQVRRHDKKNSSNTQYLEFAKQDPLRSSFISFNFLRDLYQ